MKNYQLILNLRIPSRNSIKRTFAGMGKVILHALAVGVLALAMLFGARQTGVLATVLSAPAVAPAASNNTIAYQGRIADTAGQPINGARPITFRLYNAASGGAPLWMEAWTGSSSVTISDGLFNVMLGTLNPINSSVFTSNSNVWLGLSIDTDPEMTPRIQIGSAAYAIKALTVPDGSIGTPKLVDASITVEKLSDASVSTSKLSDAAVSTAKLANLSVTNGKLADASVATSKLNDSSVTSVKIADGAVNTSDLADGSVTSRKLKQQVGAGIISSDISTNMGAPWTQYAIPGATQTFSVEVASKAVVNFASTFGLTSAQACYFDALVFIDADLVAVGTVTANPNQIVSVSGVTIANVAPGNHTLTLKLQSNCNGPVLDLYARRTAVVYQIVSQ